MIWHYILSLEWELFYCSIKDGMQCNLSWVTTDRARCRGSEEVRSVGLVEGLMTGGEAALLGLT